MKPLLTTLILILSIPLTQASYKLETWAKNFAQKYNINTYNLDKQITRKEFVETLYLWYPDYKKDRGVFVDMKNYNTLDNSKIFKDIDLNSEFWKKLSYFADKWIFAKNEYFNPKWVMTQKTFFIVMKRLRIMFSLANCKYHRICEKEADEKTLFLKWTYLKYASKIMDRSLRKYYSSPQEYINVWYKPYLSKNYYFPLKWQTLNWCYAFSVRNILKYKDSIWIYIPKIEKDIWKKWANLWTYPMMSKFDKYVHVDRRDYYHIDTLISSLQAWEPVAISYMLDYYSYKHRDYKQVPHIVAAYSFDKDGIWVSETVANKRKLVPWEKVFRKNWYVALNRVFKYYYKDKSSWSYDDIVLESNRNYLVGEF